ncbi:unnamed protein product, partial [Prorocentrum cordatum]
RASSPGGSRPPRSPGSRRAPGPPPAARQASRQGRRELPEPRAAAECGRAVSRPSCSVPRPPGVVKKARRETSGDRRCEKITTSGVWVKPPPKKQKSERQVRSAREAVRCRRPATKGAARCIRRRACWKNESGDGPSGQSGLSPYRGILSTRKKRRGGGRQRDRKRCAGVRRRGRSCRRCSRWPPLRGHPRRGAPLRYSPRACG